MEKKRRMMRVKKKGRGEERKKREGKFSTREIKQCEKKRNEEEDEGRKEGV